jgi:D-Tyr-tRNAtyr deacylase
MAGRAIVAHDQQVSGEVQRGLWSLVEVKNKNAEELPKKNMLRMFRGE